MDNIKTIIDNFLEFLKSKYKYDEQKCKEYFTSELLLQNIDCEELINEFNNMLLLKKNFTKEVLIQMYEAYKLKFDSLENYNKSIRNLLNNISSSYKGKFKENIISEDKEELIKIEKNCSKYTGENAHLKNYAVIKASEIVNSIATYNCDHISSIVDDMGCWVTYDIKCIIRDKLGQKKLDQYKYKSYFPNRERFYFEEDGFKYEYDLSVNISESYFKLKLYFLCCKDEKIKTIFDGIGYL